MLRKEDKYMLGTIAEVAKELYDVNEKEFTDRFHNCDFSVVNQDYSKIKSVEEIFLASNGPWYGIKQLNTGFDNYNTVDLFADYYGGGCGTYKEIGDWDSENIIKKYIKEIILETLNKGELVSNENTIIICELID